MLVAQIIVLAFSGSEERLPDGRWLFLRPVAHDGVLDEFRGRLGAGYYCGVCCYSGGREAEEAEWVEVIGGVAGCYWSSAMCGYGYCGMSYCHVVGPGEFDTDYFARLTLMITTIDSSQVGS
jgi:hypothetical protein